MPVPVDDSKAFCKNCKYEIKAKYQDLKQHTKSKKHETSCLYLHRTLDSFATFTNCDESLRLEGSIALFMCCHCAISNYDHLIDVCENRVTDSKTISGIKMLPTK